MDFPTLSPGQPLRANPLIRDSRTINAVLRSTAAHINGELGRGGGAIHGEPLGAFRVLLQNNAATDRRRGDVLKYDGTLLLKTDIHRHIFSGAEVDDSLHDIFILQNPLKVGDVGPAFVWGACPAIVEVIDEDHGFAIPISGQASLISAVCGPFQILQDPDGAGDQLLWVRFINTGYHAKTTSTITAASGTGPRTLGFGTAELYGKVGNDIVTSSLERTVYNSMGSAVAVDKFIQLKVIGGLLYVDVEDCT